MGKPMIAFTIEAAQEAEIFDRIIVSTDSAEIAKVAIEYGASVPFLRTQAHDDYSPVSEATCVALEQCTTELGENYDLVTQLMANTPLRTAKDIQQAFYHFRTSKAPAQISCFALGWMNPWWAVTINDEGVPTYLFPNAITRRSQDLPKLYCPTGAIWIARTDMLLAARSFYCTGHIFFPMSWRSAIDIDDEEDLSMAQMLFSLERTES